MSRFFPTHASNRSTLLALLFALVLAAAACGGSPEVESEDATDAADADATSDEGDTSNADEGDATSDDVAVGEEDDAMGEDEAMDDGDVDTTEAPATDENTDGAAADSALGSDDLASALEAGTSDRFSLPFLYLTVDQDCDGCAETMSLYYVPSEAKASILTLSVAYIDGVAQADFSAVDPTLQAGDPRRIAEQLANTDATYSVDPVSSAITQWTLDGNTVTMRCLQVDTRPVDMRTELCENSLIG